MFPGSQLRVDSSSAASSSRSRVRRGRAPTSRTARASAGPTAGDATAPAADVPEGDALEQQLVARPRGTGAPMRPIGDRDANEADVLEQEADVPYDEDDRTS